VATIRRLLKITSLFCKKVLLKRRYSAKEAYHFMESTNRSHLTVVLPYIGFVHMEGAYAAYEPPYGCLYSVQTTNSSGATIHWFRTYA